MSYIVLARKYRPQTFLEIYAQDHVTTIIKNALEAKRIAHAYLFSGPRGVGKTSLARILAKSLNCVNGPTMTPCNECSNCREITAGTASDVIEIDGASNTGVDDIRELQRELLYAPSQSKYKIYIIDEVHMLSKSAFNALLKTLEEPPENVVFIFATTEPHKVLPTIISRCQRFDFKRIPIDAIVQRLKDIVLAEEITIDSESLYLIARKADGGMRDALSLMDQVLSYCSQNVTIDKVREIFGILPNQVYQSILLAIANHDTGRIISELHAIFAQGIDLSELINDLMEFCRIVMLQKLDVKTQEVNPDELGIYQELKPIFKINDLLYIISSLMQVRTEIKSSSNPYLILEIALIKLSKMDEMDDLANIIELINTRGIGSMGSQTQSQAPSKTFPNTANPNPSPKNTAPEPSIDTPIATFSSASLTEHWQRVINRLRKESSIAAIALSNSKIGEVGDGYFQLSADTPTNYKLLQKSADTLKAILKDLFKSEIRVDFSEAEIKASPVYKPISINEIVEQNPMISTLAEITESSIEPG